MCRYCISKEHGARFIAEGVVKENQKEFLLQHGCHLIQGYLYDRPMNAKDIEQGLHE